MKYFIILSLLLISFAGCTPKQGSDPETTAPERPLNVILLIGDGMGVSQMTSAYFYKQTVPNIDRFNQVGLIKTSSGTHKITDSAAGATAYACGVKTYNGAIGMGLDTVPVKNISEIIKNYRHGLVATSSITHATPASFYAHALVRRQEDLIASQLPYSGIDFFAAGGLQFFTKREDGINYLDTLIQEGFTMDTTSFTSVTPDINQRYGYLFAQNSMPKMKEGRGKFLPEATQLALDYLSQSDSGFFLMVEGSQIDWGGHANDADYLISEMIDFDNAIGKALDFAEKDGNTLVIVTADHETGGFTLAAGHDQNMNSDYDAIAPTFSTGGHSAAMVPVLSFGKGAEAFGGIYENNELFQKILSQLKAEN